MTHVPHGNTFIFNMFALQYTVFMYTLLMKVTYM